MPARTRRTSATRSATRISRKANEASASSHRSTSMRRSSGTEDQSGPVRRRSSARPGRRNHGGAVRAGHEDHEENGKGQEDMNDDISRRVFVSYAAGFVGGSIVDLAASPQTPQPHSNVSGVKA